MPPATDIRNIPRIIVSENIQCFHLVSGLCLLKTRRETEGEDDRVGAVGEKGVLRGGDRDGEIKRWEIEGVVSFRKGRVADEEDDRVGLRQRNG